MENLNTDHYSNKLAVCFLQGHFTSLPALCIGHFQAPPHPQLPRPAAMGLSFCLANLTTPLPTLPARVCELRTVLALFHRTAACEQS